MMPKHPIKFHQNPLSRRNVGRRIDRQMDDSYILPKLCLQVFKYILGPIQKFNHKKGGVQTIICSFMPKYYKKLTLFSSLVTKLWTL